ncbi:uncharacterized protein MELLADRAFT_105619 [Melampsora larici-populina 98AG31]|uniref:Uncharacterized protein n=1 Tax=Melampsora larici-populina (strain 98AG31 / pathotype 3-4-7) TaxID=747676 RepID=F4RIT7_MELLP|nr:uncharacterized protein MELLADRAFT_105619 [Melampsora larici-populina 98AG31]EGG07620.1 hypothetical protein MELLADRAFT_105619 [Melampsora larici-populina 98AG31]
MTITAQLIAIHPFLLHTLQRCQCRWLESLKAGRTNTRVQTYDRILDSGISIEDEEECTKCARMDVHSASMTVSWRWDSFREMGSREARTSSLDLKSSEATHREVNVANDLISAW